MEENKYTLDVTRIVKQILPHLDKNEDSYISISNSKLHQIKQTNEEKIELSILYDPKYDHRKLFIEFHESGDILINYQLEKGFFSKKILSSLKCEDLDDLEENLTIMSSKDTIDESVRKLVKARRDKNKQRR